MSVSKGVFLIITIATTIVVTIILATIILTITINILINYLQEQARSVLWLRLFPSASSYDLSRSWES